MSAVWASFGLPIGKVVEPATEDVLAFRVGVVPEFEHPIIVALKLLNRPREIHFRLVFGALDQYAVERGEEARARVARA
jgi:hypothetical protein